MSLTTEHLRLEPLDHVVQLYDRAEDVVDGAAHHLAKALQHGEVVVVVATTDHRTGFEAAIRAAGADLDLAVAEGRFVVRDAAAVLDAITPAGSVDGERFDAVVGALVRDARAAGRPVRVFGEVVQLLYERGHVAEAIELELMWNELARREAFSLYCGYRVHDDDDRSLIADVCALHNVVTASRAFTGTAAPRDARSFVRSTVGGAVDDDLADDATLVVSELATNSVLHAASGLLVTVTVRSSTVRVAVRDASDVMPQRRRATADDTSGRGLRIVASLAERWGIEVVPGGKVVWAELAR